MSEVLREFGLSYDVPISRATVGSIEGFPFLKPSDYLARMVATGDFHRLLGGHALKDSEQTLSVFWKRFQKLFPQHDIFQSEHTKSCLSRCLPLYVHGDEGQTYKRKGVLLMSFQSAVGSGGSHAPNERPETVNSAGIPMNFLRNALQTRYLSVVCPKEGLMIQSAISPSTNHIRYTVYLYIWGGYLGIAPLTIR